MRIDEQRVETTLELAGIERDAALHRLHEIGGQRRQHRDAAAGVKAADHDRHPALAELHREVDRPGELVALHADQQHDAALAGPRERRDDAFGPDPGVRLVVRRDGDLHVRSEHAALGAVRRESVHRRHRVRRDGGAHPLDHVAVVVVVRRLDQDDAKRRGSGLLRHTPSDPAGFSKNVASGRFRRTAKGLPYQPSDAAAISNDGAVDERRRTDGAMTPRMLAYRPTCHRCLRPASHCYCAHLTPIPSRTRVVFLQHPREYRMAIGTARMTNLGLANSELHVGADLDRHPRVRALTDDPTGAALLFPGPGAIEPWALPDGPPATLVVLDGTWIQARKMLARSARLQRLPRVGFTPAAPGAYRIRREPAAHCLATVEAVVQVLGRLENDPERFTPLLRAFEQMVEQQLHFKTARPNPYFHAPRVRLSDRARLRLALAKERDRLVAVHVEANAHACEARVVGAPELLQLVAERVATRRALRGLAGGASAARAVGAGPPRAPRRALRERRAGRRRRSPASPRFSGRRIGSHAGAATRSIFSRPKASSCRSR